MDVTNFTNANKDIHDNDRFKLKTRVKKTVRDTKSGKKKLGRNVECTICGKLISDRRNLNRHLRSIHDVQPKVRRVSIRCSFSDKCSFVCATSTILRSHLESVHEFNIVQKELHFDTRSDFEKWKEEEEIRTCASYVTDTGVKYCKQKKIFYLRCHRSGPSRAELKGKKERLRSRPVRGYTQCGSTCPSSMQIVENQNGTIDVCYYPKHLGHKMDDESVKYMKLRRKEKEEIAVKLVQGEPITKIVNEARVNRGEQLSRVNFLQRRDVYNIKSKVNFLEKEFDEDGKNLDSWINRLQIGSSQDSPIAFYKPIDKENDYMLVVIHHIQKIIFSLLFDGSIVYVKSKRGKANVDFILTAVYIINENGDGYPLGFCVTSKTDYSKISRFFKIILKIFGTINAQIFISDNINYYYLAWKTVMGDTENKLICNFDILSQWDQKLSTLKCPFNKQNAVSEKLNSLLNEKDPGLFDSELVKSLNRWSEDEDLKLFVKFFFKFYCKKPYEWANSYRVHSLRKQNINNYLKPLYIQMEQIYAEGVEHIENALNSIFMLIRDECYMSLLKRDGDILGDKIKEIEKSHAISKDITDITFNGSNWVVHYTDTDFSVKKDSNCDKDCNILCYACDICLHSFNCCCSDYLVNFNICSHIHAVIRWNSSKKFDVGHALKENYLSSSALKFSAVSLSKTITEYLQKTDMTDMEYDKIISDLDKLIKAHSLKEKFEDNRVRRLSWGLDS